jgi:peptidoglycan LD-endopeptidase LytH
VQSVALGSNKKSKPPKWILYLLGATSPFIIALLIMAFLMGILILSIKEDTTAIDGVSLSDIGANEIPAQYIPYYQEAGKAYGINWILLAAIHRVETTFGTNLAVSSAGAIGHFQFMKCTWVGWSYPACSNSSLGNASIGESVYLNPTIIAQHNGYGVDANGDGKADPMDIEDAAHSAAKYLSANMNGSIESAVYAYNHADWYVEEVMSYFDLYSDGYVPIEGGAVDIKGNKAWPVPFTKNVTSEFGQRGGRPHNGIDISAPDDSDLGKPVVAYTDGEVIFSDMSGTWGNLVIIQHESNIKTYYAHLMKKGINSGTKVKAGQTIGYLGTTGDSTGPHLHFEIRVSDNPVNPRPYLKEWIGTTPIVE